MKLNRLLSSRCCSRRHTSENRGGARRLCGIDQQPKGMPHNRQLSAMSDCITYIGAVLDAFAVQVKGGDDYCVPDGFTRGAALNVVREAIRQPDVARDDLARLRTTSDLQRVRAK
jgi:hypothetical protein